MTSVKSTRKARNRHMKKFILNKFNFFLFDGEGGASTAGDGAGNASVSVGADVGGEKTGGEKKVVYGKQAVQSQINEPVAGASNDADKENPEDLRAKYDAFMADSSMKQFYNEDTQKIINRRFRENKGLQETIARNEEILSKLRQKYGVDSDDSLSEAIDNDHAFWEDAAADAGMSVEQYQMFRDNAIREQKQKAIIESYQRQEAARAQYAGWLREAEDVKAIYPDFDLDTELLNPNFSGLLSQKNPQYQMSMKQIYEVCHLDDIKQQTAQQTERNVVSNIRAKGQRPQEGAMMSQSASIVKDDVSKLTKKDRAEIARRVSRGEHISF